MSRVLIAASALAVLLGSPASGALAQTADAPATAAPAMSEAEFEAVAEAFGERMQAMASEMQAAITEAAGDAARKDASLDAIEARFQPEADGFASALETFLNQQAAAAGATEGGGAAQAQIAAALSMALPQIRGIPQKVRSETEQAAAAAPPA
jgi:hypothetical protein